MFNTYVLKFILHILIQIIEKPLLCILSVNSIVIIINYNNNINL